MPDEYSDTYEKAPGKMTQPEFKIATVGLLNTIVENQTAFKKDMLERLDTMNGKVASVERHKVYFRILGGLTGGVIFPALVWLIVNSFT